jgi:Lhr-like helicase
VPESAAVVERMLAGEIETTVVPANPLAAVTQQVVATAGDPTR